MSDIDTKLNQSLEAILAAISEVGAFRAEASSYTNRVEREADKLIEAAQKKALSEVRQVKSDLEQTERARKWQQEDFQKKVQSLEDIITTLRDEKSKLQERLDMEVAVTSGISQSTSALKEHLHNLEELSQIVTKDHKWHIMGKEKAHGQRARVLFKCSECPSQVLAELNQLEVIKDAP